jgi:hypothetical protein
MPMNTDAGYSAIRGVEGLRAVPLRLTIETNGSPGLVLL